MMGWIVTALVLVGCSQASIIAKTTDARVTATPPAFAVPGETLEYRVTLRGIVIGRIRIAIGEPGIQDGKPALVSRARGDTDGIAAMLLGKGVYESRTTLDLESHQPLEHYEEIWIEAPGMKEHQRVEDWETDSDQHDAHSTVALLRGWRSQPGERIALRLRVLDAQLDIEASHTRREYVPAARVYAVRYDGDVQSMHQLTAWISDDPSRVPLRIELGSALGTFVVELATYQPPRDHGP